MLLVGCLLGFAARVHSRGTRQRHILEQAAEVGGHIVYDFEDRLNESRWSATQRWFAPHLGADMVGNVVALEFPGTPACNWRQPVKLAAELPSVETFAACCEGLIPEDLESLARLPNLKRINLYHVHTLPNLQPLTRLSHLETLKLGGGEGATAARLAPLRNLPRLRALNLNYTDATDELIPLLCAFPALEELQVSGTEITAGGLARLRDSKTLRILYVDATQARDKDLLTCWQVVIE